MNYRNLFVLMLALAFAFSCSGSSSDPVSPEADISLTQQKTLNAAGPQLWGLWDVEWDSEAGEFEIVPLRSVEFACNVIKFINAAEYNLTVSIESIDSQPDYTDFGLNIGFRHPFSGMEIFTGFDVMGVFMGDGSGIYPGEEGFAIPGPGDQRLLNADGYTRRYNAREFSGAGEILPLQGYYPGGKGSPGYTPSAVLNGYKYFTDGLEPENDEFQFLMINLMNRGAFRPGHYNERRFDIRFPNDPDGVWFQYAVIANWEPNVNHPSPPKGLFDFPQNANSEEAVAYIIEDSSNAWYVDDSSFGGEVKLGITVWDWWSTCSTVMEEYAIKVCSNAWALPYEVDMTPTDHSMNWYKFEASIPVEILTSNDPLPVWIEVGYPDHDYTSHTGVPNDADGILKSYYLQEVNISDQGLTDPYIKVLIPNGGEYWIIEDAYSITWTSYGPIDDVRIEYSTDGGMTYPNMVIASTPDDGEFEWTIPEHPSTQAKIRITAISPAGLMDESDDNFTIGYSIGGNLIYGMGDFQLFTHADGSDNDQLFTNMLNLPLEGPYAENNIVMHYQCHTTVSYDALPFKQLVEGLGYEYVFVPGSPFVPLDTLDIASVKMLVLFTLDPPSNPILYTPEEIQVMKDLVNGGGILILLVDFPGSYDYGTELVDNLLEDMGLHYTFPNEFDVAPGFHYYTDITEDPITENVETLEGNCAGAMDLFGDAVSIVRTDNGATIVCKSPIG